MSTKNTNSIFPAPVRNKIILWLLGAIVVMVTSYFTLFADKELYTQDEGEKLEAKVELIEDDYFPKGEAKELDGRVRQVEDAHIKMTTQAVYTNEKLDVIIRFMEKEHDR